MNATVLEAVYGAYRDEMTAVATRLLRSRDIPESMLGSEDIVHAAFERALCAREELYQPRAYVYTTLRREVVHQAKRLHQVRALEVEHLGEVEMATKNGEDFACLVAERMLVWNALRRLPEQQRIAVAWTKMYGYTQSELAQIVRRHPGTIARAVAQALSTVRSEGMLHMSEMLRLRGRLREHPLRAWYRAVDLAGYDSQGELRVQLIALRLELEAELESEEARLGPTWTVAEADTIIPPGGWLALHRADEQRECPPWLRQL
ncbi:RNA polymerase sigma factor [Streptomyces sp. NPDC050564]|uniref:RNA polymerase sigma factor n=1 Tax=Streptomyces sp. NPDC050564 TaxID=3365631 RepID=UPI00379B8E46